MAQTTTNYNLIKPELKDAPPNITALNPNFDIIDATLKGQADQLESKETVEGSQSKVDTHAKSISHVPHLGSTSNVGNAYSVKTSEVIGANQKFTIKFNVASTAAPTLSINDGVAIPIKKPNGGNAKVYASVYTLFNDGSVFILQGEGGEYGTATSTQVLQGYTIGTENGVVQGAMPDKRNVATDAIGMATNGADIYLNTPEGHYNTVSSIRYREESLADTNNWRSDRTMFGKVGTMPVRTAYTVPLSSVWNGTDVYVRIPHGAYMDSGGEGYPEIVVPAHLARADGNIRAENIRSGVWIYGIQGALEPKFGGSVEVQAKTPSAGQPASGWYEMFRIPSGFTYATLMGEVSFYMSSTNIPQDMHFVVHDNAGRQIKLITASGLVNDSLRFNGIHVNKGERTIKTFGNGWSSDYGGWSQWNTEIGVGGAVPSDFNMDGELIFYTYIGSSMGGGYTNTSVMGHLTYC